MMTGLDLPGEAETPPKTPGMMALSLVLYKWCALANPHVNQRS